MRVRLVVKTWRPQTKEQAYRDRISQGKTEIENRRQTWAYIQEKASYWQERICGFSYCLWRMPFQMFCWGRGLAECQYYSVNLVWGQAMSVLPLSEEFNPPISCAIFTKEKGKKKERTHCSDPITKTSLTIHFFPYVACTLGHKRGGNSWMTSWVAGWDFSLLLQFPFHLRFYSSTFPPPPAQKNRSLSLLFSLRTFHPSPSWNSQNIPLSPYWTTSLFSTPALHKILLYLTYFSHRLIHSLFFITYLIFSIYILLHTLRCIWPMLLSILCVSLHLPQLKLLHHFLTTPNTKCNCYDPGNCHWAINVCLDSIKLDTV